MFVTITNVKRVNSKRVHQSKHNLRLFVNPDYGTNILFQNKTLKPATAVYRANINIYTKTVYKENKKKKKNMPKAVYKQKTLQLFVNGRGLSVYNSSTNALII